MYYTPQSVISKIKEDFVDRHFVDLCSSLDANERVGAVQFFTDYTQASVDTLYPAVEAIFANPPYDRGFLDDFIPFFFNLVKETELPYILLVNSSTSAKWYQECYRKADRVVICSKRMGFYDPRLGKEISKNRYDQTIFVGGKLLFSNICALGASVRLY